MKTTTLIIAFLCIFLISVAVADHSHNTASSKKATKAPTTAPVKTKATKAPTKAPKAPTTAPNKATTAPTAAPKGKTATTAPVKTATTAPVKTGGVVSSGTGCGAKPKLLVPLYVYPGAAWDSVAAGALLVETIAIINPNSGPGGAPDSTYKSYMTKLHNAGVTLVGYVHTSYGARAIADVKADINTYASEWPLLAGIFLDEASASSSELSYYQQLHTFIMGLPGYSINIINPGAAPAAGYSAASTMIVAYEDTSAKFSASATPSGATCNNKQNYAAIAYGATSASTMQSTVSAIAKKGFYGYIYVTDGADVCCVYNNLAVYYSTLVTAVAAAAAA